MTSVASVEGKKIAQKNGAGTKEDAAMSREEQLASLEKEVSTIKSKIKECTQGMQDAQNTLAKVVELYFSLSCHCTNYSALLFSFLFAFIPIYLELLLLAKIIELICEYLYLSFFTIKIVSSTNIIKLSFHITSSLHISVPAILVFAFHFS